MKDLINHALLAATARAETIRIHGIVQGVGFRPVVWSLAKAQQLIGWVCNDGEGVFIHVQGDAAAIDDFVISLRTQCPPLARINRVMRKRTEPVTGLDDFVIHSSVASHVIKTHVPPDAAPCQFCLEEIHDRGNRRFRYPFTSCNHCGPRLSMVSGMPYDRSQTSLAGFSQCAQCLAEFNNPEDRRFRAQSNVCPQCGPQVWLENQQRESVSGHEAIYWGAALLRAGKVLAIKGVGAMHLAVDAHNEGAILLLRERKQQMDKPFALMARDLAQIEEYCRVNLMDISHLLGAAGPIVLLTRKYADCRISCELAPRQHTLGFMLPYSPLHHLLMNELEHPIVLTSANRCGEPPCIDNAQALQQLGGLADAFLLHDRPIENRIDDSVTRYMGGQHRVLRRARGYAPTPISMPEAFKHAPSILAMGSEQRNTFCLSSDSQAILSQHMGDLANQATFVDYQQNIRLYRDLYGHQPEMIVVDKHPDYRSSQLGRQWAAEQNLPLLEVSHHHAHIAACLAENRQSLSAAPVLGIALDGMGYGEDGSIWGGEFLLADYTHSLRLGRLTPVAMPGGSKALREPWRNTYANLQHYGLLETLLQQYPDSPMLNFLQRKATLDPSMTEPSSPLASSCGRLFDAVAACMGLAREHTSFDGQAAMELEAMLDDRVLDHTEPYPFSWTQEGELLQISAAPMWQALFVDLQHATPPQVMSARFHLGLANVIAQLALQLVQQHGLTQVALSGGVFQNRVLFEAVLAGLQDHVTVMTHRLVPANDGGLSLGQWAIAAATVLKSNAEHTDRSWAN